MLFAPYSRGVAVGHGMVFIGTVDGAALRSTRRPARKSGRCSSTDFANCHGCNFTSPPVVAGDVLTYGSTAGELAAQGKIFGVEAATGKKLWEFNTIEQDRPARPAKAANMAAAALGCPAPTMQDRHGVPRHRQSRQGLRHLGPGGRQPLSNSVVALDPKSGKLKWYPQEIVNDTWDDDAPYEVMSFKKDGKESSPS